MKAFAKEVPFDRLHNRGGKKHHYCPCCFSRNSLRSKSAKTALRMEQKREMKKEGSSIAHVVKR